MKILYVITGLGLGGAEKVVAELADQMYIKGHTVKIAYLTGEKLVTPNHSNIEVINLELKSLKDLPCAAIKLKRLLNSYEPDVVHSHMFHANIISRIVRLISPIPLLISSAHSSNEGGRLRMLAYRLTHSLSDITTNVSENASESFINKKAVRGKEILTIYNGVNLDKFSNLSKDLNKCKGDVYEDFRSKLILAVGRLEEPKDYTNLINAICIMRKSCSNFKLLIAGDGSLRSELKQHVSSLKLDEYITFLGNRSDIPELMSMADIYVLSSKYEGLPTVLIEAMGCEKFIVATDCGGSREILGDTGTIVPIKDSKALAEALIKALKLSSEEISINGRKARDRAILKFSLESSVNKWLSLYEK